MCVALLSDAPQIYKADFEYVSCLVLKSTQIKKCSSNLMIFKIHSLNLWSIT